MISLIDIIYSFKYREKIRQKKREEVTTSIKGDYFFSLNKKVCWIVTVEKQKSKLLMNVYIILHFFLKYNKKGENVNIKRIKF